ncbi:MAG: thioredoxin [Anaerorhabdus sp.]
MSIIHLTKENFNQEVLQSSQPVLVDFFAEWCGPCKMLGPILEEISQEGHDFKVAKIDVDQQPDLAQQFEVISIPTIISFKDGQVLKKEIGFKPKQTLIDMVK